eukprot:15444278-Alexandrium_andersonii.AAC.1
MVGAPSRRRGAGAGRPSAGGSGQVGGMGAACTAAGGGHGECAQSCIVGCGMVRVELDGRMAPGGQGPTRAAGEEQQVVLESGTARGGSPFGSGPRWPFVDRPGCAGPAPGAVRDEGATAHRMP